MQNPGQKTKRHKISRMEVLRRAETSKCIGGLVLVGMEEAVIVFLNDCCWCEKFAAWQDLLKLLEGDALHIAAPKTHFLKDLIMYKKTRL